MPIEENEFDDNSVILTYTIKKGKLVGQKNRIEIIDIITQNSLPRRPHLKMTGIKMAM